MKCNSTVSQFILSALQQVETFLMEKVCGQQNMQERNDQQPDGAAGKEALTTDNVGFDSPVLAGFPYVGAPN